MIRLITLLLLLAHGAFGAVLNLETCRFRGDDDKTYLELYIEIPRKSITFFADSSGWTGSVNCTSYVVAGKDTIAIDKWSIGDFANDPAEINHRQLIIDARIYKLQPGTYRFDVSAIDSVSGKSWKGSKAVEVSPFLSSKLSVSDIELSTKILPYGLMPKFDRAGFGMVPGLRPILTSPNLFFMYYFEVYVPTDTLGEHLFQLSRFILNSGDTLRTFSSTTISDESGSFSELDSVNVTSLPTGSYDFSIQVMDENGFTVTNSAKFFVYRPDMPYVSAPVKLDSASIEAELREIEFLITGDDYKRVDNMNIAEKSDFLTAFWRLHDDDLSTPEVPLRRQFRQRVNEADDQFGNTRSAGHKTNRGRIYVIFGAPNSRETHPLEMHAKPYEIWIYDNIEGGVEFVFADRSGLGEYSLVHSTKTGEVHNADWYDRYVLKSGMSSGR